MNSQPPNRRRFLQLAAAAFTAAASSACAWRAETAIPQRGASTSSVFSVRWLQGRDLLSFWATCEGSRGDARLGYQAAPRQRG